MARKDDKARKPMLYITQPEFQSNEPTMQSTYRSERPKKMSAKRDTNKEATNKEESPSQTETATHTVERKKRRRFDGYFDQPDQGNSFFDNPPEQTNHDHRDVFDDFDVTPPTIDSEVEHDEEAEEEYEADERRKVSFSNRKRRSKFKEMDLEEKIDYFVNLPSQVPRMKCEVVTSDKNYRGWIQDYQDGVVHMKILHRPFRIEVPFEEIKDIELKGF